MPAKYGSDGRIVEGTQWSVPREQVLENELTASHAVIVRLREALRACLRALEVEAMGEKDDGGWLRERKLARAALSPVHSSRRCASCAGALEGGKP